MPELSHREIAQAVLDCMAGQGTDAQQTAIDDLPAIAGWLVLEAHEIGHREAMEKLLEFYKGATA